MLLLTALRIGDSTASQGNKPVVALTGGGGKTTLMFRLADEFVAAKRRVVTTLTTRVFMRETERASVHLVLRDRTAPLDELLHLLTEHYHVLAYGGLDAGEDKALGIAAQLVDRIAAQPLVEALVVEADGSRQLPLKAPANHEPVVPPSTTILMPVAGLNALGRPLATGFVHRSERITELIGATPGQTITHDIIAAVLAHAEGGAKGRPPTARLVPCLNQVDDEERLVAARKAARRMLDTPHSGIDHVIIATAQATEPVREVWGTVGAVVLAAGGSSRFGSLKQVALWRTGQPLVAHCVDQVLACVDIENVAVTVGAQATLVVEALGTRPVHFVRVPDWQVGQSCSVQAGLHGLLAARLPHQPELSAIIFLLADQPGVTPEVLSALVQRHRETLAPIVVPRYAGRRGNPVLFDRRVFPEFASLAGDIGARPLIERHQTEVAWVDWPTPEVIQDIDRTEDLQR